MKRIILTIIFVLVLASGRFTFGVGQAQGGSLYLPVASRPDTIEMMKYDGLPTWQNVFDPGNYGFDQNDGYYVRAVEKFRNRLIVAVSSLVGGGQIFSSTDGNTWHKITERGFGFRTDTGHCYWGGEEADDYYDEVWDMVVFQDRLYAPLVDWTCSGRTAKIIRTYDGLTWENITDGMSNLLGPNYAGQFYTMAEFKGMLYASQDYDNGYTMIWRSPTGDPGSWEKVADIVEGWGTPGSFHVYKGALYLGSNAAWTYNPETGNWDSLPPQLWRSFDGANWELVISDGLGTSLAYWGMGGIDEYKGFLYVAMDDSVNGGRLSRSLDGLNWQPVTSNGFGNVNNENIFGLVTYAGDLYAITLNWLEGCQVWRSHNGLTDWVQVKTSGWGDPTNWGSHRSEDQVVFKGALYIGVFGQNGGVMKMSYP